MCTSYLPDRSREIALPVVLDSMTTVEPSGTFSMNSATPCVVVLKTNVSDGGDDITSSLKTQVVQVFLCASIPTLVILFSHTPLVLFLLSLVSWIQDRPASRTCSRHKRVGRSDETVTLSVMHEAQNSNRLPGSMTTTARGEGAVTLRFSDPLFWPDA